MIGLRTREREVTARVEIDDRDLKDLAPAEGEELFCSYNLDAVRIAARGPRHGALPLANCMMAGRSPVTISASAR